MGFCTLEPAGRLNTVDAVQCLGLGHPRDLGFLGFHLLGCMLGAILSSLLLTNASIGYLLVPMSYDFKTFEYTYAVMESCIY